MLSDPEVVYIPVAIRMPSCSSVHTAMPLWEAHRHLASREMPSPCCIKKLMNVRSGLPCLLPVMMKYCLVNSYWPWCLCIIHFALLCWAAMTRCRSKSGSVPWKGCGVCEVPGGWLFGGCIIALSLVRGVTMVPFLDFSLYAQPSYEP